MRQQCQACHCDDGHAATVSLYSAAPAEPLNNEGASERVQHVVISFDIGAIDSQLDHQEQDGFSGRALKHLIMSKTPPTLDK